MNHKLYIILIILAISSAIATHQVDKYYQQKERENFEPQNVWEHYCYHTLNKYPDEATPEDEYLFLDVFSETDEYQELYEIYHQ